jgi:hypothetical protein
MLRQFEAERAPSIAIVMCAARRPDYRDMTLTFAIALGEVVASTKVVYESGRELRTGVS